MYNYNLSQTFGVDSDPYTGVVPLSEMRNIEQSQITKFVINQVTDDDRYLKLRLDPNTDITGVKTGSEFQLKLSNTTPEKYKVINVGKGEGNLYDVTALQFEDQKFTLTEANDFDFEENKHNIGIPLHEINRPLAPIVSTTNPVLIDPASQNYSVDYNNYICAWSNRSRKGL